MSHSSSIESFPTHVLSINTMSDTRNGDKNEVVKQSDVIVSTVQKDTVRERKDRQPISQKGCQSTLNLIISLKCLETI